MKYILALSAMWLFDLSGNLKQSNDNCALLSKGGFWWTSEFYDLNPDLREIDTLKLTYEEPARPDNKHCITLWFTRDSLTVSLPSTMDTTWYPENIQPKHWERIVYSVRNQEGLWFGDKQNPMLKVVLEDTMVLHYKIMSIDSENVWLIKRE
ncbi:MAG: hypothetical protein JST90_02330 [Bacteroidetes bacterium]|nr:hypothetical protein [Bacteroidota bacterium]